MILVMNMCRNAPGQGAPVLCPEAHVCLPGTHKDTKKEKDEQAGHLTFTMHGF